MFKSILAAVMAALIASFAPAFAEDNETERTAAARELIEIIGGADIFNQLSDASLAQSWPMLEKQLPTLSKKDLDIFKEEFTAALHEEIELLVDESAKIYARHLSVGEMRASINFYKTPEGQAMLKKLPVIMSESLELGNRHGAKVGINALERARTRLKERGVEI